MKKRSSSRTLGFPESLRGMLFLQYTILTEYLEVYVREEIENASSTTECDVDIYRLLNEKFLQYYDEVRKLEGTA